MIFLAVFAAMLAKDILGTAVITLLTKQRPWLAGYCDAAGDLAALFCIGLTGANMHTHGVSAWTVEALTGLVTGSMLGTVIGAALSNRLAPAPTEDH